MSKEIYQKFEKKLDLIRLLINDDYCLMTFYDKYYISCFPNEHSSHTMVVNGYDDNTEMLICNDYIDGKFMNFKVNYDEYIKSVEKYDFFSIARLGLLGIKVKPNCLPINYSITYMELQAFLHSNIGPKNNVGIGVFKTLNDILDESQHTGKINLHRRYEFSYHILEGAFLMSERLKYLSRLSKNNCCHLCSIDNVLQYHAKIFYCITAKINFRREIQPNEYTKIRNLLKNLCLDFTEEINGMLSLLETLI